MHKLFENKLFNTEIKIESHYVKLIRFYTPLGQDLDFNSEYLKLDYSYHVLNNKKDIYDYILILEFSLIEVKPEDKSQNCMLNVIVEGIYHLNPKIKEVSEIESAKHFGSLNLLLNYLRTVIFNITSMTSNGGIYLPLIDIRELHLKNNTQGKPKRSIKLSKKK
jgi:preprotein translocase subunit SecB